MFSNEDLKSVESAAESVGINGSSMVALGLNESNGTIFWTVGGKKLPAIRPETHKFYAALSGTQRATAVSLGLAHPTRNAIKLPTSYAGIYDFYRRMQAINVEAAANATSHGWGQVMGFNYSDLGYSSARELAERAATGLNGQTELVARFIQANGLIPAMNALPLYKAAVLVAERYNGSAWAENNYANKLIANYNVATNYGSPQATAAAGRSINALQTALVKLGYNPGDIDGLNGNSTQTAVREFQRDNGLTQDGKAGTLTWTEIDAQLALQAEKARDKTVGATAATSVGITTALVGSEVIGYVRDLQTSFQSVLGDLGFVGPIASVAVASVVGYFVYSRFFKKG